MTEHASAPWPSSSSPQSSPVSTPAATTGHKPKMTASSSTAASSFSPAVSSMPPAHPLRRAFTTVGDVPSSQSRTAPFRRRIDSSSSGGAAVPVSSGSLNASGPSSGRPHSTSSTARRPSDLRSLAEARRSLATGADRLLNPRPAAIDADDDVNGRRKHDGGNNGRWAGLPLASALLPAAAGMLFEGAGAFLTDIMLLALAGVFLYWSVTQPWKWYHAAREIRIVREASVDSAVEDDSDLDSESVLSPTSDEAAGPSGANADEKGKQTSGSSPSSSSTAKPHPKDTSPTEKAISRHTTAAAAAMSELRALEALYLLLTAVLPMLATYLLHAIRARLTRPSGGLVSNYNLAIFLLAAELRPLSHAMALLHVRTLHLQRVVAEGETSIARATEATAGSGRGRVDGDALAPLLARLEALEKAQAEARAEAAAVAVRGSGSVDTDTGSVSASRYLAKQSQQPTKKPSFGDDPVVLASITRQVRAALQPDVDAIARATRRYEKKAAVLAYQTETRLRDLDARVDDAVALAAAAATGGASGRSRGRARLGLLPTVWLLALLRAMGLAMLWLLSAAWAVICIPFRAAYNVLIALPARTLVSLLSGGPERRRMRRRMRAAAAAAEKEKERERAGKRSGGSVPVPGASSTAGGAFTVAPLTRSASGRRVAGWAGENENSPSRIR